MSSEEFTGHVGLMRADNEFFGAEDFIGKPDTPAQIVKCVRSLNRKACGKSQPEMYTLFLTIDGKPSKKEFWLKATNRKMLTKLYEGNVGSWKGKWIWLYVDECKSPSGGMTFGIRIRDRKDAPKQAAAQQQKSSGEYPEYSKLKATWSDARQMNHQPATGNDFRAFVESATDGNITAENALKGALFTPDIIARCVAAIGLPDTAPEAAEQPFEDG